MRRFLVFPFILSFSLVSQLRAQQPPRTAPRTRPQSAFAPYFALHPGWQAQLGVNNGTGFPLTVYPTLYSLAGAGVPMPPVALEPHEHRLIDLREWVVALGDEFRVGSLRLDYESVPFGLGAQLSLRNEQESLALDVLLRLPTEFRSSRLEGIWGTPNDDARIALAVANTADTAVNASLVITGPDGNNLKSLPLHLSSHETRILNLREVVVGLAGSVGGLSIRHDGSPGAVMAQAFVTNSASGFSGNLTFVDPAKPVVSKLDGAGILLGGAPQFTGHLFLRNVSTSALEASPAVQYGTTKRSLGAVVLHPGEAKEIHVSPGTVPAGTEAAGLEVAHTGPPGSLIGHWFSVDASGNLVVETPLRSPGPRDAQAGNNPWSLEGDTSAILYIKNIGTEKGYFVAHLWYPGGVYVIGMHALEPGETKAVDIRGLRDRQIPDDHGHKLPLDLLSGQVFWSGRRAPVIGRVNVMSVSKGIASNMSCPVCCCWSSRIFLQPSSSTGSVGGSAQEDVWAEDWDTCGHVNPPYLWASSSVTWSSSNSTVASVSPSPGNPDTGIVQCLSPGSALIQSDDTVANGQEQWWSAEDCWCYAFVVAAVAAAGISVKPDITGPNTVWYLAGQSPSGYATSITLTSSGGQPTVWTITAGSDKIRLSTTSGSQTTVTSSGSAFSSAVGDIKIKATVDGVDSEPFAITSRKPYRLVAGTISTQCDSTYAYLTFLNYSIQDQLLTSLPSNVPVNERWTTAVVNDYSGTNWRRAAEGSTTTTGAAFADQIGGEALTLPPVPVPDCAGASTAVQHWGQEWRVGSLAIGTGSRVQTDTLQKYINRAAHLAIVSPAP